MSRDRFGSEEGTQAALYGQWGVVPLKERCERKIF